MDTLFPQYPPLMVVLPEVAEDVPLLGIEVVDVAVRRLQGKLWKAPGPDEIRNAAWSSIHAVDASVLTDTFDIAMVEGSYPVRWKKTR